VSVSRRCRGFDHFEATVKWLGMPMADVAKSFAAQIVATSLRLDVVSRGQFADGVVR
jgi:hypothetical protein